MKVQSQNQHKKPFLARAAMPLAIAITLASAEAIVWQAAAAQSAPQPEQMQTTQSQPMEHGRMQQKPPSFATLDTNSDGVISRQEAEAFAPLASDFDRLVSENSQDSMGQDKNSVSAQHEGITRSEYRKWKAAYPPGGETEQPGNPSSAPYPPQG